MEVLGHRKMQALMEMIHMRKSHMGALSLHLQEKNLPNSLEIVITRSQKRRPLLTFWKTIRQNSHGGTV